MPYPLLTANNFAALVPNSGSLFEILVSPTLPKLPRFGTVVHISESARFIASSSFHFIVRRQLMIIPKANVVPFGR